MADSQLTLTVNPTAAPIPWGPLVFASYVSGQSLAPITTIFDIDAKSTTLVTSGNKATSNQPLEILQAIAGHASLAGDSTKSATFIALASTLASKATFPEIVTALDSIDDHLTYRTFLVGHTLTVSDWTIWGTLKGSSQALGVLKKNAHPHLSRWYSYIESLPSTQEAYAALSDAKSTKKSTAKASSAFALGLPGAIEGQVVTRFPPEPSGYLHIGHAKAALLNQYFAQMYKGKLIIRFDDTNPSKEKSEFEQTILEDLELLGIRGDMLTHTSDHFEKLYQTGLAIIKSGKAYADDTEQLQMRAERMDGIASGRRNSSVEDNLARFAEMTKGTEEGQRWCIRAKISVDDNNKALRDPVIYRCNILPHHRTGSKWKVYPTYDFACPVVDALEGVTHALRTNEYRDRNPQYQWMLDALNLRKVEVWDFSRVNFIYTLLSKRKLLWFVDQKLVTGWDDPRFPTVRGIRRRGLTVDALRQFMLAQGPSQAQIMLEWDGIWATNKKIIDPIAPRLWAIQKDKRVPITLRGGPKTPEIRELPLHKKNPDVGTKKTVYSSDIYVEQEDAQSFEDNEEVTLMDWGNAIIKKKVLSPTGEVTSIEADLFLEGDFKKTKKKVTWLAEPSSVNKLTDVVLIDYDYLITKKKLEEGDDVAAFVTPQTEFRTEALGDANVASLKKGDIIQFERKGYYILDNVTPGSKYEFVSIPDGRAAGLASKAGPPAATTTDTGAKKTPAVGGWGKNPAPAKPVAAPVEEGRRILLSEGSSGFEIPVTTNMYNIPSTVGSAEAKAETTMYKVPSVYESTK